MIFAVRFRAGWGRTWLRGCEPLPPRLQRRQSALPWRPRAAPGPQSPPSSAPSRGEPSAPTRPTSSFPDCYDTYCTCTGCYTKYSMSDCCASIQAYPLLMRMDDYGPEGSMPMASVAKSCCIRPSLVSISVTINLHVGNA